MGIQDNERNGVRQGLTGAGSATVTSLRIARIQRAPVVPDPSPADLPQTGLKTGLQIGPAPIASLPRLDSRSLFGGSREVVITHDGAEYRLRLTASGKLILTK